MLVLRFIALILLLVSSAGPGLWLLRGARWSPLERLCAVLAASGAVLYLASALIYVLHLPRWSDFAVSLACLGWGVAGRAHARLLLASREVRRALAGFSFLFFWALLLLALVRSYSGAAWSGDWIEHYQRVQFFLEHQPVGTLFIGAPLPARPPFMNLLGAHFLAQVGERYDLFQVAFVFLNLLAFIPCGLMARLMVPRAGGRAGWTVLACLFAANPLFLENATYAWTKGVANFYVIIGLWFYLRGWRRSDPARLATAFLALAAGLLVHYSAAPYAIMLLAHYGLFVLAKPRIPGLRRRFLAALLPGAALLGTWLGWSIAVYGAGATFGSNTTARAAGAMPLAENLRKIALNLFHSVVPHPLRLDYRVFADLFFQPNGWGIFRDYFFTIVQTSLVFGMGCVGGLVVLFLLVRMAGSRPASPRDDRPFWLGLALLGAVFTVATHPTLDLFGVAHVCSQPLLLLGLTFLAASFASLPRALRLAVAVGCAVDLFAGIFLHFSLQGELVAIGRAGGRQILGLTTGLLSRWAVFNSIAKSSLGYRFWGDHFAGHVLPLQLLVAILSCLICWLLVRTAPEPRPHGRRGGPARWAVPALAAALGTVGLAGLRAPHREMAAQLPALAACAQNVARHFDSAEAHYELGLALYANGRVGEAFDQWTEVRLLQPDQPLARYLTLVLSSAYTLPPSADLAAAEAVHEDALSGGAQVGLAVRLWTRQHHAPAIAALEQASRLQPGDANAQILLGSMNLELGRWPESIAAFDAALPLDGQNPRLHYLLGWVLHHLGRDQEAGLQWREALRLQPVFPEAKAALQHLAGPPA
jgi:tetratricopeptide (TPR) repeat protein